MDIKIGLEIILIIIGSWLFAYMYAFQESTLRISKILIQNGEIPVNDSVKKTLNLTQTLLTSKNHSVRQIIFAILFTLLMINSILIHWYLVFLSILLLYVVAIIIKTIFFRKELSHYISFITEYLIKQKLKFEEENNIEKSIFLNDLIKSIQRVQAYSKNYNPDLDI